MLVRSLLGAGTTHSRRNATTWRLAVLLSAMTWESSARVLAAQDATVIVEAEPPRSNDRCPTGTVPLDARATEPSLWLADIEPRAPVILDPVPVERLAGSMIGRAADDDPRLPVEIHRRATAHLELERYWELRARAGDRAAEDRRAMERRSAIRTFATLVESHPRYADIDVVLVALGDALRREGQLARALLVYRRVLERRPRSNLTAVAGVRAAESALAGGDAAVARDIYEDLLSLPASAAVPHALVRYQLAWARRRLGDHRGALRDFVRAASLDGPSAELVRPRALMDLASSYVRVRPVERAVPFIRRLARSEEEEILLVRALISAYSAEGRRDEAASLAEHAHASAIGSPCDWVDVVRASP